MTWQCSKCGFRLPAVRAWPVRCVCGAVTDADGTVRTAVDRTPSFVARVLNYATASIRWVAAGRPVRTDAEMDVLLAVCKSCKLYVGGACSHPSCGCNVGNRKAFFGNKLRWATEQCPLDKWPKPPEEQPK